MIQIDFVSDIACPWCAIGLHALEAALGNTGLAAEIRFQPFELNPAMPPEGEDIVPHLQAKYGISPEQIAVNQQRLRERGAELGFHFGNRSRIWNTFAAHRLLHEAGEQGPDLQRRLKHALLRRYHGEGQNPGSVEVLREAALEVGLRDAERVIDSDLHLQAVREAQAFWRQAGIQAVPAVVLNRRLLVSGGQPVEVFEQALRQAAAG
ncbi:DsbA family protein [Inhella sp.]|uniref:DsbA family oxidoreductase n=1 Tax=Inhella sp. TaxID=1921806 RepID=UPI0035B147B3